MSSLPPLAEKIEQAMAGDQHRLRRRLRNIEQAAKNNKPFDRNLDRLQKELKTSVDLRQLRQARVPEVRYDESLPVVARRQEITDAISAHQVVVVCGETGSGKSTQLPKICLELGRGVDGVIGHTQPRRIAARSVASRLAEELNSPLGESVGYKIRFADATKAHTHIKLMTDGILLAESQSDRFFNQYDTIILDEAHERSLNVDFLIGYLKRLLPRRPDLRLIVTSATLDAERFAKHFASEDGRPAPVIEVSGRTYPVEVRYRPLASDDNNDDADWETALAVAVEELSLEGRGDILAFLPTERDIREAARVLRGRILARDDRTEILPLYARLSAKDQNRVFHTSSHRRIVLATNVAESSLTVPGIRYVVDVGTARVSRYSPKSKVQRLPIEAISRASADQRKGRCGRIGPGICIRLYSEEDYLKRDEYTQPEIQRTNLASVILQTQSLNLGPIEEFPFIDAPKQEAIRDGYKTLYELKAIDERRELTELGRRLARLPVDPRIGRMVLAGHDEGCLAEILIIAAALEVQDPRERPVDHQQAADEKHAQFVHGESDFLTYLKLWDFYHHLRETCSRNQLRRACRQNFLSYNRLREWSDVQRQLQQLASDGGMKPAARKDTYAPIHRALLTGLLSGVARRGDTREYTAAGGGKFFLWPGSGVFESKPQWIVASEMVETSRRFLRTVARIDPSWIEPLAEHLVKRSYSEPHWSRKRSAPMCYEKVSLFGLPVVARRPIAFGPIDASAAREIFIRHGLVEGDVRSRGEFFQHNQQVLEEVRSKGAKLRRGGYLADEYSQFRFYDQRVPEDVYSGSRFERWRKKAEQEDPNLLRMTEADLIAEDAQPASEEEFPNQLHVGPMELPLSYQFDPGQQHDGVTLVLPQEGLSQLSADRLGWLVPGLVEAKVVGLIKSLPKSIRRGLIPAPDVAKQAAAQLRFGEGPFLVRVAEALEKVSGERVPIEAFDEDKLPPHLKLNVKVVDSEGKELASSRDLAELRDQFGAEASSSLAQTEQSTWGKDGVTAWDFGELPKEITVERAGIRLPGYPTLVDRGDSVALRLEDTSAKANRNLRGGLRRLFYIKEKRELNGQAAWLPEFDKMQLHAATICSSASLREQLALLIAERTYVFKPLPRTEEEFEQRLAEGENRLLPAVQDVARLAGPLLKACHETRVLLEGAKSTRWQYAIDDMRQQTAELLTEDFLIATPWQWLTEFPRYLKAIQLRFDKLKHGSLARDQVAYADVSRRWSECVERKEQMDARGAFDPELETYRWMLEEYRVSLFAQELGAAVKVSPQKLDKQWSKIN